MIDRSVVSVRYGSRGARGAIAAALAVGLLGLGGCSTDWIQSAQKTVQDLNQNVHDLETVKQALIKHYALNNNNVNVSVVGNAFDMKQASVRSLTVQMINVPAGQLDSSAQEQAALEIARIAYASYDGSLDPTNVVVIFVEYKNYFVLQYNSTSAPYTFERSELVGEGV
ncbi:MAG TPA: hypothetical protein V6C88_10895 [Chroococcidiopsis sp.]